MAKPIFFLKRNDTSRAIKFYPQANPASSFAGATVVFNMADQAGGKKINRGTATIGTDTDGTYFAYEWSATDTNLEGDYDAEFEVTLSDGSVETYPNDNYINVRIMKDLG